MDKGIKSQGRDLARRKPTPLLTPLGGSVLRAATDASDALLSQAPPRITRAEPEDAPAGSVVVPP